MIITTPYLRGAFFLENSFPFMEMALHKFFPVPEKDQWFLSEFFLPRPLDHE